MHENLRVADLILFLRTRNVKDHVTEKGILCLIMHPPEGTNDGYPILENLSELDRDSVIEQLRVEAILDKFKIRYDDLLDWCKVHLVTKTAAQVI